jgi:hypothetical protein
MSCPVNGESEAMSVPLYELQNTQAKARFSETVAPPLFSDYMFDLTSKNVSSSWIRQYSHSRSARSETKRLNTAET